MGFTLKAPVTPHPILLSLHCRSRARQLGDKRHVPHKSSLPSESPGLVFAPGVLGTSSALPSCSPSSAKMPCIKSPPFRGSDDCHGAPISRLRGDLTCEVVLSCSFFFWPCPFVEHDSWHHGDSEGPGVRQLL